MRKNIIVLNGLRTVANDPDMFRNDAVIKYPRVFF